MQRVTDSLGTGATICVRSNQKLLQFPLSYGPDVLWNGWLRVHVLVWLWCGLRGRTRVCPLDSSQTTPPPSRLVLEPSHPCPARSRPCRCMDGSDIFCAGRVPDGDLQRTLRACGGAVQTSVNDMSADTLGLCERFEERQVGGERFVPNARGCAGCFRVYVVVWVLGVGPLLIGGMWPCARYNFFSGCPQAKTCTIIMRGGAEQVRSPSNHGQDSPRSTPIANR